MAYALIGSVGAQSSTGDGVTTGTLDTTGANLIVVAVGCDNNGSNLAPSDSAGNTWTPLGPQDASATRVRLWYCATPTTSASHTFSVTGTGNFPLCMALAFSGASATPFDVDNGNNALTVTSLATNSITPAQDNELIVSAQAVNNSEGSGITVDSGMTRQLHFPASGTAKSGAMAYKIQTTAAAINPTWTVTDVATNTVAVVAAFKVPATDKVPYQPQYFMAPAHAY